MTENKTNSPFNQARLHWVGIPYVITDISFVHGKCQTLDHHSLLCFCKDSLIISKGRIISEGIWKGNQSANILIAVDSIHSKCIESDEILPWAANNNYRHSQCCSVVHDPDNSVKIFI